MFSKLKGKRESKISREKMCFSSDLVGGIAEGRSTETERWGLMESENRHLWVLNRNHFLHVTSHMIIL